MMRRCLLVKSANLTLESATSLRRSYAAHADKHPLQRLEVLSIDLCELDPEEDTVDSVLSFLREAAPDVQVSTGF